MLQDEIQQIYRESLGMAGAKFESSNNAWERNIDPNTGADLGYLEYEQYGTGSDTFNGSNAFYSVGNAYSGNTPNSNAHTFYAQLKSLYSEHCEFIRINRVSGATAESKITIITDTEIRKREMDRAAMDATEIFIKIFGDEVFGPRIQHYFRNGCLTLMEDVEDG